MSGTLNKVMLIGHLGDEVKIHRFEDGGCIGRFPLATNETYMNKQTNERVSNTEWHNIVLWRGLADIAEKYLNKGDKIYIEGKLRTRSWQDQEGNNRYTTEVVADNLTMLGKISDNNPGNANSFNNEKTNPSSKKSEEDFSAPDENDDLPF